MVVLSDLLVYLPELKDGLLVRKKLVSGIQAQFWQPQQGWSSFGPQELGELDMVSYSLGHHDLKLLDVQLRSQLPFLVNLHLPTVDSRHISCMQCFSQQR